jgi:hypothetical protein
VDFPVVAGAGHRVCYEAADVVTGALREILGADAQAPGYLEAPRGGITQ